MGHPRKRKYLRNEVYSKEWRNADQITLKYLDRHGNSTFGNIFRHVNEEFEENGYGRKGFSLRLVFLMDKGLVGRIPIKQGHYLYHLTKKGEKNLELTSIVFRNFAHGLLKAHFLKNKTKASKGYNVERIVQRVGIYMLFSCINGILQYTSPTKEHRENVENMKLWIKGINPGLEMIEYLDEVTSRFVKFDSDRAAEAPMMKDKNRLKILEEFQEILRKKYPEEYLVLEYGKKYLLSSYMESEKKTRTQAYKRWEKKLLEDLSV